MPCSATVMSSWWTFVNAFCKLATTPSSTTIATTASWSSPLVTGCGFIYFIAPSTLWRLAPRGSWALTTQVLFRWSSALARWHTAWCYRTMRGSMTCSMWAYSSPSMARLQLWCRRCRPSRMGAWCLCWSRCCRLARCRRLGSSRWFGMAFWQLKPCYFVMGLHNLLSLFVHGCLVISRA